MTDYNTPEWQHIVHTCGQFNREETRGKDQAGQVFTHQKYRWVIVAATPNWVYAKPSDN